MSANAIKILSDDGDSLRVAQYGVVWGGKDLVGDTFTAGTDLWLDKLSPTPPVLFDHGGDQMLKRAVVGRVVSTHTDDVGLWVEAKLTASKKYLDAIRHLIAAGALGWSSGAVGHLVERSKGGLLKSWAIAEFSLTPTPCEPRTLGVRTLKSLAALEPALESVLDDESLEDARVQVKRADPPARERTAVKDLPDSAFAYIEAGGTLDEERKTFPRAARHVPHHDEAGDVDLASLKSFVEQPNPDEHALSHMMAHARAAGLLGLKAFHEDDTHDEVHQTGVVSEMYTLAYKFLVAIDLAVEQRRAMEKLGHDTKSGERMYTQVLSEFIAIRDDLTRIITRAEDIDRGIDGKAVVDMYRTAFELLDLEEVA